MDRQLRTVATYDRDDLKQRRVASGSKIELGVVVLILDRHGMCCGVLDVRIGDPMLTRRRMDIHEREL